jgi:hypothetical protein
VGAVITAIFLPARAIDPVEAVVEGDYGSVNALTTPDDSDHAGDLDLTGDLDLAGHAAPSGYVPHDGEIVVAGLPSQP